MSAADQRCNNKANDLSRLLSVYRPRGLAVGVKREPNGVQSKLYVSFARASSRV